MLVGNGRITILELSRWTEKGGSYRTIQRLYHTPILWLQIQWILFTRECLGIRVATIIHTEDVTTFLDEIMQKCSSSVFLRSDKGSEFTAKSSQTWLATKSVGPAFIPLPHSSLKYKTPVEFAVQFNSQIKTAYSLIPDGHKN